MSEILPKIYAQRMTQSTDLYNAFYKCPLCDKIIKYQLPSQFIQPTMDWNYGGHNKECIDNITDETDRLKYHVLKQQGLDHVMLQLIGVSDKPAKIKE
jgi:hypothetical protein